MRRVALLFLITLLAACGDSTIDREPEAGDPAEVVLGERLFLETRFAQHFHARNGEHVNQPLADGDPVLATTQTSGDPLPGPFAGASMNCRACHLVDEQGDADGGGIRTYADFARHSPLPDRGDGRTVTPRNSPSLVHASIERSGPFLLHFDGEFTSVEDLVVGTMTGRNFGWLANERATALAHIAAVIRGDDGQGLLAADFGALSYKTVLGGTSPSIPAEMVIRPELRIDVDRSDDAAVVAAVAGILAEYVRSLQFIQTPEGEFDGSPYDRFLAKNDLPRAPAAGESDLEYARRLRGLIDDSRRLRFVDFDDGGFHLHAQEFRFGREELEGLRLFLRESSDRGAPVGNCVACHTPPNFTDFSFHNTGVTQLEYDDLHGAGAFAALAIPASAERAANPGQHLPPSETFPLAAGPFLDVPSIDRPGTTDLGLWNVFGNASVQGPQAQLSSICAIVLRQPATPAMRIRCSA